MKYLLYLTYEVGTSGIHQSLVGCTKKQNQTKEKKTFNLGQ